MGARLVSCCVQVVSPVGTQTPPIMRALAFALAALCLVAAVYCAPAPAENDALEPKDDLKTDATYGLGYAAYPAVGYYGSYGYGYPYGYGYGLYGYPSRYWGYGYGYGYPAYYL